MKKSVEESVLKINQSFYHAFEEKNLTAMKELWLHRMDVRCIHPGGVALFGWEEVIEGWKSIFEAMPAPRFVLRNLNVSFYSEIAFITLVEEVSFASKSVTNHFSVLATNIFHFVDGNWKMIHHHATPVNPEPAKDRSFQYN